jgi:hypothetical protein
VVDLHVYFRTYCYGCRRGARWHGRCLWPRHRWDWEYYIMADGRRLVQRQSFASWDRAWRSAQRSWAKLAVALREV